MSFRGLWIDAELLTDPRFSRNEMLLLAYMLSLPTFHASDEHMARTLGLSHGSIRNLLTSLRQKGCISGHGPTRKPIKPAKPHVIR